MGTPEFSVAILENLKDAHEIVGVVTVADKPAGRGQKLHESAVKKYAVDNNFNILQPTNLKAEEFTNALNKLEADLFVVVAFRMLPEIVWQMPPMGTINLHASLLPNYRGAAPINWAIINGETKTGVTTFFIEKEIDTGKIIERKEVEINENETAGELHDILMKLGAETTLNTVNKIAVNDYEALSQLEMMEENIKNAPKIFKEDCKIDFKQKAKKVHDFVRGLDPYPAAWCQLQNKASKEIRSFKLFTSRLSHKTISNIDLKADAEGLYFPCEDEYIIILEIQMEGKRRMTFKEFQAGNNINDWKFLD